MWQPEAGRAQGQGDRDSMRDARRQPTQARHNQSTRRDSGLSCRNMEILLALNLSLRNDLRAFGSRYPLPPPTPAPHALSLRAARATGTGSDSCAHSL